MTHSRLDPGYRSTGHLPVGTLLALLPSKTDATACQIGIVTYTREVVGLDVPHLVTIEHLHNNWQDRWCWPSKCAWNFELLPDDPRAAKFQAFLASDALGEPNLDLLMPYAEHLRMCADTGKDPTWILNDH